MALSHGRLTPCRMGDQVTIAFKGQIDVPDDPLTMPQVIVGKVVDIGKEREKRSAVDDIVSGKAKDDDEPVFVKAGKMTLLAWEGPLISLEGELWRYERGIWKRFGPGDEAEVEMGLQKSLMLMKASPSITNKRNGYKWLINHPDLFRKGVTWDGKPIVVGRNAVLEIDTSTIRPHAEDDYATRRVGCELDPEATCPVWMEFIGTILDEDVAATVQEWFGSALVRGKRRELTRALIAKGPLNTGKTQISNVLRALLSNQTCGVQIRHLESDFGLQTFVDSTGWVADDAVGQNEKLDPESFKILVTGESVSVMRKHLPPLEAKFDFPVLLTCNHLPKVRDDSNAVYKRLEGHRMTAFLSGNDHANSRTVCISAHSESVAYAERGTDYPVTWVTPDAVARLVARAQEMGIIIDDKEDRLS